MVRVREQEATVGVDTPRVAATHTVNKIEVETRRLIAGEIVASLLRFTSAYRGGVLYLQTDDPKLEAKENATENALT